MWFRVGLVAIVLSFVPWLAIAVAPLLGLSLAGVAGLVTAALVAAEVLFWTGLALAGRDTWRAIKSRGWRHAPRELLRLLVSGPVVTSKSGRRRSPVTASHHSH
jgi:hypothetical protein